MNLTIDPWIPVIAADGSKQLRSLQELFATAHEIRDLSAKPHEKIALLRLLICITQAALDGPENFDAWETCRDSIEPAAKRYLDQWRESFELFGDGTRFLQVPGLKATSDDGEGNAATKLDISLSSGNTATVFDNGAGEQRTVPEAKLALTLLTYQTMSPCGIIGAARWQDVAILKCTAKHAPGAAGSMLHTYLLGESLLSTLYLNLLNKEEAYNLGTNGWGRPVWEVPVARPGDNAQIANATGSYLGRLVPLSRAVKLDEGRRRILLTNGLEYPLAPTFREPAATMILRDDVPGVLGASLGRSIWRQLSPITVKRRATSDPISGPLALNNIDSSRNCTLWVGALVTDKAKIEDVIEGSYDVPAGMFRDAGRKLYEEGVGLSERWQESLSRSVKTYAAKLNLAPVPYDRARHHFWTAIEQYVPHLLELTGNPEEAGEIQDSKWGRRVKEAAQAAYEFTCPHQTPRQIEAYSLGLQQLYLPKPKDSSASAAERKKTKRTK